MKQVICFTIENVPFPNLQSAPKKKGGGQKTNFPDFGVKPPVTPE